jgi:hypothetical protein
MSVDRGPQDKAATEAALGLVADLPDPLKSLCRHGRDLWRSGRLAESSEQLEQAHLIARELGHLQGRIHADHLLGCLRFAQGRYGECRDLHAGVLRICRQINHRGAMGSSLYDLAQVDWMEGNLDAAQTKFLEALRCYEEGGYPERTSVLHDSLRRLREQANVQPSAGTQ